MLKRDFVIPLFCIFFISCVQNPKTHQINYGTLKFDKWFHDFGKIKSGDTVFHTFSFVNKGSRPVIIYDISASCGCTIPEWTQAPVLPDERGFVKVQFTKRHDPGVHIKHLIIKANTKDPYTVLKISATINK